MKLESVCKDCNERHIGCHGYCEKYIEAKIKYEKAKIVVKDIKDKDADVRGFRDTCFRKQQRGKGRKA